MKKQPLIIGLAVLVICLGLVIAGVLGRSTSNQNTTKTSTSMVVSMRSLSEDQLKTEVYTTLQEMSNSIEQKDKIKFEKYVNASAVCASLVEPLYVNFESLLGPDVKNKAINQCSSDLLGYASGEKSLNSRSAGGNIAYSLQELFAATDVVKVRTSGTTISAVVSKPEGDIGFLFSDTGEILRLNGIQVAYTIENQ